MIPISADAARRRTRRAILFSLVLLAAACGPRNAAEYAAPAEGATEQPIYIATQRELDRTGPIFGEPRPSGMNYFRNTISVPPNHAPGRIEWPEEGTSADASRTFAVTDTEIFRGLPQMIADLRRTHGRAETVLFVHGYNNTLSDAMYRLAQIKTDFDLAFPSVLFSWASAGDPRGYIYDRDSVLYARDDLMHTLDALTAQPGDRVLLLAHSMGAQLTMEVLREAALKGDRALLDRISGVVLLSPDIDPELFRRQAEAVGKLPQPFIIFASREDRALSLSGFLTGRKPRLGVIDSPEKVKGLDVTVVDMTAFSRRGEVNHEVAVSSPTAIALLKGMLRQANDRHNAFDRYMVLSPQPCGNPNAPRLPVPVLGPLIEGGVALPGTC